MADCSEVSLFCYYKVITKEKGYGTSIINIGNSKGLRLSKTILEKYSISDKVELILEKDYIILKPKAEPRKGWDKAFEKCTKTATTNF